MWLASTSRCSSKGGIHVHTKHHPRPGRMLADCLEHDLWAVKGGVNLRAFFDSIRFSEDLDLDVVPIKRQAIKTHLMRILKAQAFLRRLRAIGIQDLLTGEKEISKDTATTLRLSRQLVVGGAPYSTYVPAKTALKLTSPPAYSTPVPSVSYSTQVQNWLDMSQKKLMGTPPTP